MHRRAAVAVAISIVTLVTLSACGPGGDSVALLFQDQAADDILPAEVRDDAGGAVDLASTHLMAQLEGTDYYAARSADSQSYCVVAVAGSNSYSACSGGLPLEWEIPPLGIKVQLVPDWVEGVEVEGWHSLSRNLLVAD